MAGFAADVMCSCSRTRSAAASPPLLGPGSDEKKAKTRGRAFRLSRAKSRCNAEKQQHQPASNNNNTPLMSHCQVGGELKHVCSNCRGTGPLDGKSTRSGSERDTDLAAGLKRALLPGTLAVCRVSLRFCTGRGGGATRQCWGSGPASSFCEYETTELLTIDLFFVCIRNIRLLNYGLRPLIS